MQAVFRAPSSGGYASKPKNGFLRTHHTAKPGCRGSLGAMRGLEIPFAQCGTPSDPPPAVGSPSARAADSPRKAKNCLLFHAPETAELAQKISEEGGEQVELGVVDWRKFDDGFPNLFVKDAIGIRNRHVAFLASFHKPSLIFDQISVIYALPRLFISSFTLILPFFPTGTQERVDEEGEIATAFTLARILSNIPSARGGPTSLVIFDIHALQERFYFGDSVLPLFESGIPLLVEELRNCGREDEITIAYPDEGAWKRFNGLISGYPEIVCTKVRDGARRIVRLKEGEPRGRHVVIVDDLVQSGGTLLQCHGLLASLGAKHVSAFVTHAVFPKQSWKKFNSQIQGDATSGFHTFWITDSCPQTVEAIGETPPFKVLSLAAPIAQALQI